MSDPAALALLPAVDAARRGDRAAFARLVDETRGVVCAITLAVTRDVAASEDVAQEVYLDAWRGLARLRNPASFLPWLRQLARNKARMAVRTAARARRRLTTPGDDTLLAAAADPSPDALAALVVEEERAALAAALDALPDASREVLVLYYREGRSVRQAAELLGLGEDAVKQRLARARARVRRELLDRAGGTLARSAPGAAFTAGVAAALAAATPGIAAAGAVGLGKGAAGAKLAGQLGAKVGAGGAGGAAAGGALLGAGGGLLAGAGAVLFGARRLLREARDEEERRGIRRYAVVATLGVAAFVATVLLWPTREAVSLSFAALDLLFYWQHFHQLPRITARRRAAERIEDPAGAAARERRRRRHAVVGFTVGSLAGWATILPLWL